MNKYIVKRKAKIIYEVEAYSKKEAEEFVERYDPVPIKIKTLKIKAFKIKDI